MAGPSSRGVFAAALLFCWLAPSRARALDLEQVLVQVDAADPALASERLMVRAALARERRAGAWDAPMLDLMVENVPVGGGFDEDPMTMRTVGLEQTIDLFGARGLARRAARRDTRSLEAVADAMRWERFGMAWMAYAEAWFAGERARVAADHRGVMERMSAAARARYESGRGRLEDMLRAEAERVRVNGDLAMFAAEESAARAQLDALRGLEPGSGRDSLVAPPERLAADSVAAWRSVLESHPRIRAAAEREAGQRGRAAAMKRMAWPELRLRAEYGYRSDLAAPAGGIHGMETVQDDMWGAGVGVMLPIFYRSRQGAEAKEMTSMADAAAAQRRATTLELAAGITALRARARAGQRMTTLLQDTVLTTRRRALEAAWSGYGAGSTDLSSALAAAHASYAEELELTHAREALAGTLAKLLELTARPELFDLRVPAPAGSGRTP